jgi:hypothetical protein
MAAGTPILTVDSGDRLDSTPRNRKRCPFPESMPGVHPYIASIKGRTPMTESSDFGTFGRYEEVPVGEMPADMKDAYDYTMELRGQVPGPLLPDAIDADQGRDRDRDEPCERTLASGLRQLRARDDR